MNHQDVCDKLKLADVEHMLTGSYAINGHGKDVDILVRMGYDKAWHYFCSEKQWPYPNHCKRAGGNYPDDNMSVWKIPAANVDLLVCHTGGYYTRMVQALAYCKGLRTKLGRDLTKEERVVVHQCIVDECVDVRLPS